MAYHILIAFEHSTSNPIFDKYLGTAAIIDTYWESVGRKLSLPLITSFTEKADSEDGFVIEREYLVEYKDELEKLEEYWKSSNDNLAVLYKLFDDIEAIKSGVDNAISNNLKVIVG